MGSCRTAPRQALLPKLACGQGQPPAREVLTALHPAGTRDRIVGLVVAAHCNDRLGTRIAVKPPMPLAAGRIAVLIDSQTKIASLSWANLSTGSVSAGNRPPLPPPACYAR